MKAHELARQLLRAPNLPVTFSTFYGPTGLQVWGRGVFTKRVVHVVREHDEPQDFIEIMVEDFKEKT